MADLDKKITLNELIELYESSESNTADDVLDNVQRTGAGFALLSREEKIQLKRAFFEYVQSAEEVRLEENRFRNVRSETDKVNSKSRLTNKNNAANRPRERRRPHKKYIESFISNISAPKSINEMYECFMEGNDAQLLMQEINTVGSTSWTVPRWAKRGDIVLFMHAKTARTTLTKLRSTVRTELDPNSKEAKLLEHAIANQISFHTEYGGKIFAVGRINGKPERADVDSLRHLKTNIFCDIDDLFLLESPIDISEFNSFIKVSRQGAITPVYGSAYEELKKLIAKKNYVPEYFNYSYSTPFPHSLVNHENWMKLGLEYRNSFTLEVQFRQCYVNYLLGELGDQKKIYAECPCYKGTNPITFVDNVFRIGRRLLPVEVKLNIMAVSNLEGQCEQYCKLDRLILDKKKGRDARISEVVDDRVLVIDTFGVYLFDHDSQEITALYDLSDLKAAKDVQELRQIVLEAIDSNKALNTMEAEQTDKEGTKVDMRSEAIFMIGFYHENEDYGCFSNWYPAEFDYAGMHFANSEQFMMYHKVMMFNKHELAKQIMRTSDPGKCKKIAGQKFPEFDANLWDKTCKTIVKRGVKAKFAQNEDILRKLLGTGNALLAECSLKDKKWGIGIDIDDPDKFDIVKWKGRNLLGRILMEVREELHQEIQSSPDGKLKYIEARELEPIKEWNMTAGELKRIPQFYHAIHAYSDTLRGYHERDAFYHSASLYDWEIAIRTNMGGGLPVIGFYEMKQDVYDTAYRLNIQDSCFVKRSDTLV